MDRCLFLVFLGVVGGLLSWRERGREGGREFVAGHCDDGDGNRFREG